MSDLNRDDRPPRIPKTMHLRRLKAGERFHGILLAPLWGVWTHWNGNRSEPCFKKKVSCPGHRKGLPSKWKGYFHVWNLLERAEEFLEVSPVAADQILDCLTTGHPARGHRVTILRGNGTKARLKVEVNESVPDAESLPQPKDPNKTLRRLWGIADDDGEFNNTNEA